MVKLTFLRTKREAALFLVILALFGFLVGTALAANHYADKYTLCLQAAQAAKEASPKWLIPFN